MHLQKERCTALFPEKKKRKAAPKEYQYTQNAEKRYECPHCDTTFSAAGNVANHLKGERCTALFPEKKKRKAAPKESQYTMNAHGRYECPHCDLDFARDEGARRHVENSCPSLFPGKKQALKGDAALHGTKTVQNDAGGGDEPMLPVGSRVNVLWVDERYPATIIAREIVDQLHFYDVQYGDGSYGEDLTVELHELQLLGVGAAENAAGTNASAPKRKVADVDDDLQQQQSKKKSKSDGATGASGEARVVEKAGALAGDSIGSAATAEFVPSSASQESSALKNTPRIMKAHMVALEETKMAALEEPGAAASEESAQSYASEVSALKNTVKMVQVSFGAAEELARNRKLEIESLKKTVDSLKTAFDAVQELGDYYKERASTAEESAKFFADESNTAHAFSEKQTSAIDRLRELALNAGVDVGIVTDAANVK